MDRIHAWAAYAGVVVSVSAFATAYCDFFNKGKTERE